MEINGLFLWPSLQLVDTAAFPAGVRGSAPRLGGLKETKMFLPHPRVKLSIVGSLRDKEVACPASDLHKGGLKPDSSHFQLVDRSRAGALG